MKLHKYVVMKDGTPLNFACNSVHVDFSGSLVLQALPDPLDILQETITTAIFASGNWQAIFLIEDEQ